MAKNNEERVPVVCKARFGRNNVGDRCYLPKSVVEKGLKEGKLALDKEEMERARQAAGDKAKARVEKAKDELAAAEAELKATDKADKAAKATDPGDAKNRKASAPSTR